MSETLQVHAPLNGWCAGLDDSPDPVFSGRLLGDGVSIDPVSGELLAPFDAEVLTVPDSRHAINLRAENGAEFLIHIGIDTVNMGGDGFEALVSPGDKVSQGDLLIRFDLEAVLRGASSLRTPVLLLQSDRFECRAVVNETFIQAGDPIFEVHEVVADAVQQAGESARDEGPSIEQTLAVGLEHGIHARPAAGLIEAIKPFKARVSCEKQGRRVDARSPVALMSLGVVRGDVITVIACGEEAEPALAAFVQKLDPQPVTEQPQAQSQPPVSTSVPISAPEPGSLHKAQPASPGLAMGGVVQLASLEPVIEISDATAGSAGEEQAILDSALLAVRNALQSAAAGEGTGAAIATAHLALLDDPMTAGEATDRVADGQSAAQAWTGAVQDAIASLEQVTDSRLRERVDDLRDIDLRVRRALAGEDPDSAPELPEGCIVVADNLLPSQLLGLDRERLNGICLAAGGATSHVAILAVSLRIPMLVAAGARVLAVEEGVTLLLDADLGEWQYAPDEATCQAFEQRAAREAERQQAEAAEAHEPCITTDGQRIHINANLASAKDAEEAVAAGAEGCGLLRTEFAFMDRPSAPTEQEQLSLYQDVSAALGDRPLVVRTLDAGGDKPMAYVPQGAEENPALGVRGIRLVLNQPELLETQLRALLQVRHARPLQVMLPMISSVSEVLAVRELLPQLAQQSGADANGIRLGVMIETPAAAMIADRLAEHVDFFSIGTNDLTQYTLCMDRGEPLLAGRLDVLHPAVLRLVGQTAQAAEQAGIPAAVCGGAAGDLLAAPILLGLGVRELSMPASLVARQKARLRELSLQQCRDWAAQAVNMNSARDVRAMMRDALL